MIEQPPRRAVVLDRDGVINADSPEYIKSAREWQPLPGSLDAIAALTAAGFEVYVVTNQSGLGRGLFDLAALAAIHEKMCTEVARRGGHIRAIYWCPHTPSAGCRCRKPGIGLLEQLAAEQDISLAGTALIGDKWSDMGAAIAAGMQPVLVLTGHGEATRAAHGTELDAVYADLAAAARMLLAEGGK